MFVEYLPSITALLILQILGLMSPGPDFAIVVRNSLVYSRKTAIFTAIGLALGVLVHLSYILLGLGVIISKTAWLFLLFKYVGASYLIYIGIKGMRAKKHQIKYVQGESHKADISMLKALSSGFFTNATNPKAMLFFLSLISAFVTPKEPVAIIIVYVALIFMSTLLWFVTLAICFSHKRLSTFFKRFQYIIERVTGGLLVVLGVKILFAKI